MSAPPRNAKREMGEATHAEIIWLASFGMGVDRIAERLGLTRDAIESHATGRRGAGPIKIRGLESR
jgi:predicted transcriptional regulator